MPILVPRLRVAGLLCAGALLFLSGCGSIAQSLYLRSYDRDISNSTKAIAAARDNAQRAAAYTRRGSAYSEKARYSRAFKLVSADEYDRLFGLAIKDHDQAIALDASAEAFYSRGVTYYERANLNAIVNGYLMGSDAERKAWFAPAAADFKKAVEMDGGNYLAWDRLGMAHSMAGELDQAISDYSQEMRLNPLGRARLADAYCARGGSHHQEKKHDASIADYEKSIETGATADGCSCDPYNPLLWLYTDARQYDQGWEVVHKMQKSKKWIQPEFLDQLKKDSGRSN